MVTQTRRRILSVIVLAAVIGVVSACDKVPLLAPTGTVITVLPATTVVPAFGETEIIATVIEQGTSTTPGTGTGTGGGTTGTTTRGSGTPVQNGTLVSFTTTIGRIEPREARTQNGEVRVKLVTNGESGTAKVTAYSGGASGTSPDLTVGTAAVGRILVTASPQSIPSGGGQTQVTALVTDAGGRPLAGIPVTFTTNTGTLSQATATTDANGVATTTLNAGANATVTARAGSQSGTVDVRVNARATFTVTPSTTSAGTPVTFTVGPPQGSTLQSAFIDFGDGDRRSLGPIAANATIPKAYDAPGQYTATLTGVDASGETQTMQAVVLVGSPNISVSGPATVAPNTPATFTVQGISDTAQVREYRWTANNQTITTSSRTFTTSFPSRGTHTVTVSVIGINGGVLGTAQTQISVQGL